MRLYSESTGSGTWVPVQDGDDSICYNESAPGFPALKLFKVNKNYFLLVAGGLNPTTQEMSAKLKIYSITFKLLPLDNNET